MNPIRANFLAVILRLPRVKIFKYERDLSTERYESLLLGVDRALMKKSYQLIEIMFTQASDYTNNWLQYQALWDLQPSALYERLGDDLELWCYTVLEVKQARSTFDTSKDFEAMHGITIQYGSVQTKVNAMYDQWQKNLLMEFSVKLAKTVVQFHSLMNLSRNLLEAPLGNATQDLVNFIVLVRDLRARSADWGVELKICGNGQKLLERQRFQFPTDWLYFEQLNGEWSSFLEILQMKSAKMVDQQVILQSKIKQDDKIVSASAMELLIEWNLKKPISGNNVPIDAIFILDDYSSKASILRSRYQLLETAKEALNLDSRAVDSLKPAFEEMRELREVWVALSKIYVELESLMNVCWTSNLTWNVKVRLEALLTDLKNMSNRIRQYLAFNHLQERIQNYLKLHNRNLVLKSEALRERHWVKILSLVKIDMPLESITVGLIWDCSGFQLQETAIEEIVDLAQGEMSLEEFLKQVRSIWNSYSFEFTNFQSRCRLVKGWDEMFNKCQEHLSALSAMKHSVHFKAFKDSALALEDSLSRFYALLDIWVKVQKQWVYLQGIFIGNQEIKLILPMESSRFLSIDTEFMALLRKVYKSPLVFDVINLPNIQHTMQRLAELLGGVQKSLGEYLERERVNFARFYFLADEDLLEILGNSKDLSRIQPHLKKMFSAVHNLVLSDNDQVIGVSSKEGEQIMFLKPVFSTGRVYQWLSQVETESKNSLLSYLLKSCKDSCSNYLSSTVTSENLLAWIQYTPAQIMILTCQIKWTEALENSLGSLATMGGTNEKISNIITLVAKVIVQDLDLVSRKKCESLITELVYQRDVIRQLMDLKVCLKTNFSWLSQMRFYIEDNTVLVKMANSVFKYGFEYLGIQDRLVQTPLTDRCYLTLTQAMHNKLGGSPFGPAGEGNY